MTLTDESRNTKCTSSIYTHTLAHARIHTDSCAYLCLRPCIICVCFMAEKTDKTKCVKYVKLLKSSPVFQRISAHFIWMPYYGHGPFALCSIQISTGHLAYEDITFVHACYR